MHRSAPTLQSVDLAHVLDNEVTSGPIWAYAHGEGHSYKSGWFRDAPHVSSGQRLAPRRPHARQWDLGELKSSVVLEVAQHSRALQQRRADAVSQYYTKERSRSSMSLRLLRNAPDYLRVAPRLDSSMSAQSLASSPHYTAHWALPAAAAGPLPVAARNTRPRRAWEQ